MRVLFSLLVFAASIFCAIWTVAAVYHARACFFALPHALGAPTIIFATILALVVPLIIGAGVGMWINWEDR